MRIAVETHSSARGMGVLRMILNKDITSDISAIFSPSLIFFVLFYERHIPVLSIVTLIIFVHAYAFNHKNCYNIGHPSLKHTP